MQGSADDRSRVWEMALSEYVFISGTIFLVNARGYSTPRHYTLNFRLDQVCGWLILSMRSNTSVCTCLRFALAPTQFGQLWGYINVLKWIGRRRLWRTGSCRLALRLSKCSTRKRRLCHFVKSPVVQVQLRRHFMCLRSPSSTDTRYHEIVWSPCNVNIMSTASA